jgi:hypothetical protein
MFTLIAQATPGVEGFDEPADVVLAPTFVTFLITLALPFLVALVTKAVASDRLRAVILLVLTAANTLIGEAIVDDGSAIFSKDTFLKWMLQTAIAVFAYLGFWKPVTQVNQRVAPNVGLSDVKTAA